jgi:hypothetical protein
VSLLLSRIMTLIMTLIMSPFSRSLLTICLNPVCKETAQYCGHSFCRQCIIDYSKHTGKACPVCRQRLCKEIHPRTKGDIVSDMAIMEAAAGGGGNLGNIDGDERIMEAKKLRGLIQLSDSQVLEETKVQGIYSDGLSSIDVRAKLLDQVCKGHGLAKLASTASTLGGTNMLGVELSATHTIAVDTISGAHCILTAPYNGPVIVEIAIKGVPAVATRLTSLHDNFCLGCQDFQSQTSGKIRSRVFREDFTKKRLKKRSVTCLERFVFSVGGVEVTLRIAL